jgi:hypothetical protein
MDHRKVIFAYERAWAQFDEGKIRSWLAECWTPSTTYQSPLTDIVTGLDSMVGLILDYQVMFPDAAVERVGDADVHHTHVRWPWRLSSSARIRVLGHDYGHAMHGEDIVDLADGRISRVVSFFREFDEGVRPTVEYRSLARIG